MYLYEAAEAANSLHHAAVMVPITSRISSGSRRAASAVEPTRSTNITVLPALLASRMEGPSSGPWSTPLEAEKPLRRQAGAHRRWPRAGRR